VPFCLGFAKLTAEIRSRRRPQDSPHGLGSRYKPKEALTQLPNRPTHYQPLQKEFHLTFRMVPHGLLDAFQRRVWRLTDAKRVPDQCLRDHAV
jgi:hypothetical protein